MSKSPLALIFTSTDDKIFNFGVGAFKTNRAAVRPSVKSPEQWAYGRIYSAVMGGKAAKVDAKQFIFV